MLLSWRLLVLLILPPLLWACNSVVARLAIDSIGPLWLNALRWGLALLLLLPLGWKIQATPAARDQVRRRWAYLGMLGLNSLAELGPHTLRRIAGARDPNDPV